MMNVCCMRLNRLFALLFENNLWLAVLHKTLLCTISFVHSTVAVKPICHLYVTSLTSGMFCNHAMINFVGSLDNRLQITSHTKMCGSDVPIVWRFAPDWLWLPERAKQQQAAQAAVMDGTVDKTAYSRGLCLCVSVSERESDLYHLPPPPSRSVPPLCLGVPSSPLLLPLPISPNLDPGFPFLLV